MKSALRSAYGDTPSTVCSHKVWNTAYINSIRQRISCIYGCSLLQKKNSIPKIKENFRKAILAFLGWCLHQRAQYSLKSTSAIYKHVLIFITRDAPSEEGRSLFHWQNISFRSPKMTVTSAKNQRTRTKSQTKHLQAVMALGPIRADHPCDTRDITKRSSAVSLRYGNWADANKKAPLKLGQTHKGHSRKSQARHPSEASCRRQAEKPQWQAPMEIGPGRVTSPRHSQALEHLCTEITGCP